MSEFIKLLKNAVDSARTSQTVAAHERAREAQLSLIVAFHQRRYEDFQYFYAKLLMELRLVNLLRAEYGPITGTREPIGVGPAPEFKLQTSFPLPSLSQADTLAELIAEQYHDGWRLHLAAHLGTEVTQ